MSRCSCCGRLAPVLKRATKPEGQRFVGMCKNCIEAEFQRMRDEVKNKIGSIFSWIFS